MFYIIVIHCSILNATENWDFKSALQSSFSNYSDSIIRDNRYSVGFSIIGDYLNRTGFSLIYGQSKINYNNDITAIKQNEGYLSIRHLFRSDTLHGTLHLSLAGHIIRNNDPVDAFDHLNTISPSFTYVDYGKNYALGLSYAQSNYPEDFTVRQWSPSIGFAFYQQQNWLTLKGYFITSSDKLKSQGEKTTQAIDISISHYFQAKRILPINKIQLSVLLGERIFAVEGAAVYNLADLQKESFSVSSEFRLVNNLLLTLAGGLDKFENKVIDDDYSSLYLYANISSSF